jgi:hypothetical protein
MKRYTTMLIVLVLMAVAIIPNAFAQISGTEDIKNNLPKMLGANNVGKEFWFSVPPCFADESAGWDNFIKIFVTSAVKTPVVVEVPGKGFFVTKSSVANDVIEFNIYPLQGQPYTKTGPDPNVPEQIFPGAGVHVYADQPLVVYCVVRYKYTSDGWLCIPVSSLGKDYIVAGWNVDAMFRAIWNYKLPNVTTITAPYNDTKVRFTLGGNSVTKTAGGMKPGDSKEWMMSKSDVVAISTNADEADLSGSRITANKPVAVVTGNQCNNIPTGNQWCDYTAEMDIPTFTWGTDYHVPKVPGRKYPSIIRIFGKEPNTNIFRDGKKIGEIKTGGGIEGNAFLTMRMSTYSNPPTPPRSVVISGDKAIGVTLYNTGTQEDNAAGNSDPFVMVMTPMQQYQKEITFCTPGIAGAMGFPENYVNFVYEVDEFGLLPADVEFANVIGGQFQWAPMKAKFSGVDELFSYKVNGKSFAVKTITLPGDGTYKIRAKKPFAAYSFGYSSYDSYGFPTSAALADLERPDTNAPVPKYKQECNGNVKGATVTDMPDDIKVRSNMAMIVIDPVASYNYIFTYGDFIPGEARTVPWELIVDNPAKDAKAVLMFTDRRGNDTTITILYTAVKLSIQPANVDYGLLKLNTGKVSKIFNAVNESTSRVFINEIKLKQNDQHFTIDSIGATLPQWLDPQGKILIRVTFDPNTMGKFIDSIGVGDTCVFNYYAQVKAEVKEPLINVTDIDFGTLSLNDPAKTLDFQIKNPGGAPLVITGFTGPTDTVYTHNLPPNVAGLFNTPMVIPPSGEAKFTVTFKPTTVNIFPDEIVFSSDAPRFDSVCVIMGKSIEPGLKANDYDWKAVRIDRPAFPKGPYPCAVGLEAIKFSNDGSEPTNIINISYTGVVGDKSAFINANTGKPITATDFIGMVVDTGIANIKMVPITFQPKVTIHFENSANLPVTATLKGIGLLPKLEKHDYDFGQTVVSDFANIQTRTIVFKNLNKNPDNTDYLYADTVYIQDLILNPAGSISQNLAAWGTDGWQFDKAALGLPKLLNPGEELKFDAFFVATKSTDVAATVKTVSEAEADVTSNWIGKGLVQGMESTGGAATICVGQTQEINLTVKNSGSGNVTVGPLSLMPSTPYLDFKNAADKLPRTLVAGETVTIPVVFAPTYVVDQFIELIVPSSVLGPDSLIKSVIHIKSLHYSGLASAEVINPNLSRTWPQIGDAVPVRINYRRNDGDMAAADVKELRVTMTYNGGILKLVPNSIVPGADISGFTVQNIISNDKAGKLSFTLMSNGTAKFNSDGEIARMNFATFLRTAKDSTDFSMFVSTVEAFGNACISISDTSTSIKLIPTCAYDLRVIATTGNQYSFQSIAPNPVDQNGTTLNFSVALEGWTEIAVYNTVGELVTFPVAGNLKPGEYSVTLPVKELTSGSYLIRMQSGPFTNTQEMVIRK